MSNSIALPRFPHPIREAALGCVACKVFRPEVLLRGVALCWICAHHVVDHGTVVEHAAAGQCECLPGEIYPPDFFSARATTRTRA